MTFKKKKQTNNIIYIKELEYRTKPHNGLRIMYFEFVFARESTSRPLAYKQRGIRLDHNTKWHFIKWSLDSLVNSSTK